MERLDLDYNFGFFFFLVILGEDEPATIVIRVGNSRPDLGVNAVCNRYTGFIEEGRPLFLVNFEGALIVLFVQLSGQQIKKLD